MTFITSPLFGALTLKPVSQNQVRFTYRHTAEDQYAYVGKQQVGSSVHAEFPHNFLPHLVQQTPNSKNCRASLLLTLKAALADLHTGHPALGQLQARLTQSGKTDPQPQAVLEGLEATLRPKTISGTLRILG